jgi:hypothetical protein
VVGWVVVGRVVVGLVITGQAISCWVVPPLVGCAATFLVGCAAAFLAGSACVTRPMPDVVRRLAMLAPTLPPP